MVVTVAAVVAVDGRAGDSNGGACGKGGDHSSGGNGDGDDVGIGMRLEANSSR